MKFLVDTMCGRLARWLRILGYDAVWLHEKERKQMIYRALQEDRILITRDHRYEKSRGIKKVILQSEMLPAQLRQLTKELKLSFSKKLFFSICSFCNQIVKAVDKKETERIVPPFVYEKQKEFFQCPECRRIYWPGSHKELFEKQLTEMLTNANKGSEWLSE